MRWLLVGLVAWTACGGSGEGVLLELDAEPGVEIERLEIILASADPEMIQDVERQRIEPTELEVETVRYYRQRATTGEVLGVGELDGFTLRLEPNLATVPEGALIPILLGFTGDQITAIGSVLDTTGMPLPVEIVDGQLLRFTVSMMTTAQTDAADGLQVNEVVAVDCGDFRSGIAWRPGATQLRLILPDRSQDPAASDASLRKADLDCDGRKATDNDCDDLRFAFHAGAEESCDGIDHDCDGAAQELVPCTLPNTTCAASPAFGVCSDRPGGNHSIDACAEEPECACADGACAFCSILAVGGSGTTVDACTPAVATDIVIPDCDLCTVEVLARPGDPFLTSIALAGTNQFTQRIVGVPGKLDLRVEAFEPLSAVAESIVGGIFLAVESGGEIAQLNFAIKVGQIATECGATPSSMVCIQP